MKPKQKNPRKPKPPPRAKQLPQKASGNSTKKKFTASEKKQYVLSHLGVQTYAAMAAHLACTEANVYLILAEIRKDRDTMLISKDLIATAAEEQFNRLNMHAKVTFTNLMNEWNRVQGGGSPDNLYNYTQYYNIAERQLTHFLKAVGVYLQDTHGDEDGPPGSNITVIFNSGLEVAEPRAPREANERPDE